MIIKTTPEFSDPSNTLYIESIRDLDNVTDKINFVWGDDAVRMVFGQPLSEVVGCTKWIDDRAFIANYKFSEQMKNKGRSKAFNIINNRRNVKQFVCSEPTRLCTNSLSGLVAFDCETGGKSKVRCITFYDGTESWFVDCRDIKSNKQTRDLLIDVFTDKSISWVAHNFAHDCKVVMNMLKIDYFPVEIDTITCTDAVEYRNLQYLAGVYLGIEPYKHELDVANKTQDFNALVRYCAKDSMYTYMLSRKIPVRDPVFTNQFIHTMLFLPELKMKETIFDKYPELTDLSKSELKKRLTYVKPCDVQLLIKSVNIPKPNISLHSKDGFKIDIPDELTYDGTLWFKSSSGYDNIQDIMAHDVRFNSPELSVYRYKSGVEPILNWANYDIPYEDVFLVNDVICLSRAEHEGFKKCTFEEVKGLLNV